jgi:hypothetical protein
MPNMAKVEREAPGLISLAKTAAVTLEQHGLTDLRAAVYLVLDHSLSMRRYYADGSVQRLAEQALALCAHLDDDGVVPLVFFSNEASRARPVRLPNHRGIVNRLHQTQEWGSTNLTAAMRAVLTHYHESQARVPALVIVQTDGNPNFRRSAAKTLAEVSELPLFWSFVGFGPRVEFLTQLDKLPVRALDGGPGALPNCGEDNEFATLPERVVDNASAFHAVEPLATPDEELYDGLLREVPTWLDAARTRGVL